MSDTVMPIASTAVTGSGAPLAVAAVEKREAEPRPRMTAAMTAILQKQAVAQPFRAARPQG